MINLNSHATSAKTDHSVEESTRLQVIPACSDTQSFSTLSLPHGRALELLGGDVYRALKNAEPYFTTHVLESRVAEKTQTVVIFGERHHYPAEFKDVTRYAADVLRYFPIRAHEGLRSADYYFGEALEAIKLRLGFNDKSSQARIPGGIEIAIVDYSEKNERATQFICKLNNTINAALEEMTSGKTKTVAVNLSDQSELNFSEIEQHVFVQNLKEMIVTKDPTRPLLPIENLPLETTSKPSFKSQLYYANEYLGWRLIEHLMNEKFIIGTIVGAACSAGAAFSNFVFQSELLSALSWASASPAIFLATFVAAHALNNWSKVFSSLAAPLERYLEKLWMGDRDERMCKQIECYARAMKHDVPLLVQVGKAHSENIVEILSGQYGWKKVNF